MAIFITIVGISVLIVWHELGHYLVARACNMRIIKFSLGFGPKLWEKKVGETTWRVAAILLGGYVQIHGMGPTVPGQPAPDERSYKNRPLWQRALVILAGPVANWLLAAVLIMALAVTVGAPRVDDTSTALGNILPGSPAETAGLEAGDRVVSVNGKPVADWPALVEVIQANPEKPLELVVERRGERKSLTVTPRRNDAEGGVGQVGVYPSTVTVREGPWGALLAGLSGAWNLTAQQTHFLWGWITGHRSGRLAGLPEIVKTVSDQTRRGLEYLFGAMAELSITLFILNLVPIPALDGSRILFLGIEAVRRRPVAEEIEATIHGIGFLLLLALLLFVSIRWFFV
jgi:regulator of sigma E protease